MVSVIIGVLAVFFLTLKVGIEHLAKKKRFMNKIRALGKINNAKQFRDWVDTLSITQLNEEMKKIRKNHIPSHLKKFLLTQHFA